MRIVYCKSETHDHAIDTSIAFFNLLKKRGLSPTIHESIVECNGYRVEFVSKRQFDTLASTKPMSAYLTIPYNRLLLSANGVKPEDCKLVKLTRLITKGYQ